MFVLKLSLPIRITARRQSILKHLVLLLMVLLLMVRPHMVLLLVVTLVLIRLRAINPSRDEDHSSRRMPSWRTRTKVARAHLENNLSRR